MSVKFCGIGIIYKIQHIINCVETERNKNTTEKQFETVHLHKNGI